VDLPGSAGVFDGVPTSQAEFTFGSPTAGGGGGGGATGEGGDSGGGDMGVDMGDSLGKPKRVREVCFTCWSRGQGAKCELHLAPGEKDRPVPPGKSALVCGNWDLAAIARKFRSEEIQEVRAGPRAPLCPRVCVSVRSCCLMWCFAGLRRVLLAV
jgi:hypothetical protein